MKDTLKLIKDCQVCQSSLSHSVRPVVTAKVSSEIIIVGQAPGRKVHETGLAWNDPSGDLLRTWMGIDRSTFYNTSKIALIPMGFCYPGKGKSGDLPPRKECAPLWHQKLFDQILNKKLVVLIGQYSQKYYLEDRAESTLTETVKNYQNYLPQYFPLPHPSPRNRLWMKKNPWFDEEIVPIFKEMILDILN